MTAAASPGVAARWRLRGSKQLRSEGARRIGLVLFLILEVVIFANTASGFFGPNNFLDAGRATAVIAIVSVGATFGLISGALDISIGSVIALGGVVSTILVLDGAPAGVAIAAAGACGLIAGLINGIVVVKFRVHPVVATLAMLGIARGLAYEIAGGPLAVRAYGTDDPFFNMMQSQPLGVPLPVLVAAAVIVCGHLVLAYTRFGRYAYAIGGNARAGRDFALHVDALRIGYLTLSGFLAGFAGWVYASMVGGVAPTIAQNYELTALTAVMVGGVGLNGGSGSMIGTLLGILILGVMVNGLTLSGVPAFYQLLGQGLVLLGAVGLDALHTGGYR